MAQQVLCVRCQQPISEKDETKSAGICTSCFNKVDFLTQLAVIQAVLNKEGLGEEKMIKTGDEVFWYADLGDPENGPEEPQLTYGTVVDFTSDGDLLVNTGGDDKPQVVKRSWVVESE